MEARNTSITAITPVAGTAWDSAGAAAAACAEAEQGDAEQRYRGGLGDRGGHSGNAEIRNHYRCQKC